MKDRKALEVIFESFINGDVETAREGLHEYFVGQAKGIYQSMMEDEELDFAVDEPVYGGDEKADFEDDVTVSDGEEADEVVDEPIEDRVDELESTLEELKAKFDALLADEELEHGIDYDADASLGDDSLAEALDLAKKVSVSLDKEGVLGPAGGSVATDKAIPLVPNKKSNDPRGAAVDFAGGSAEAGAGKISAEDEDDYCNFDLTLKKAPAVKTKPVKDDNPVSVVGSKKIK